MKKLKTYLSPRKLTLILSIIILIVSISFVNEPSQSQTQGIVSSIAVDYEGDEIQLACAILTPTSGSGSNSNMYSAKAPTIAEAVELIGMQLGKDLGFAQCDIVAIGQNLMEKNVVDALDYFTRTKKVGRNVLLLSFEGKTDEFIESVIYMEEKLSLTISQILDYNKEYLLAVDSNLENFFLGYYGNSGVSLLPKIVLTDEQTNNGIKVQLSASPSEQSIGVGLGGDGETGGETGQKEMNFVNSGTTAVVKNGKALFDFIPSDIQKLNLFFPKNKYGTFRVSGITDEYYNDATVVLKMENKKIDLKYTFKDDKPTIKAKVKVYIEVNEIIEETKNEKLLRRIDALVTQKVQDELKKQLEDDLNYILTKQKTMKADCLELYSNFDKYNHKKWGKYINSLADKDDYLKGIELETKVEVAQYI